MLSRVLEPEVMDSAAEAQDYDAMDHGAVNRLFVDDFLKAGSNDGPLLDVGTGTAQIPIELCGRSSEVRVVAIDLAEHMLRVGVDNLRRANLEKRVQLEKIDAKRMPYAEGTFGAVISNSIVHHIPEPMQVMREMVRVVKPGGLLFVRDLLRPADDAAVHQLVQTYAGNDNAHQQKMFDDSLRAALTVDEVADLVAQLGFERSSVMPTSDRHWTWSARRA